jgi:hypothetical protein
MREDTVLFEFPNEFNAKVFMEWMQQHGEQSYWDYCKREYLDGTTFVRMYFDYEGQEITCIEV